MSDSINAPCRPHAAAVHNDGPRPMPPKLIVLHDTEGGTAASIAAYFTTLGSGGSAQLVTDDNECFRCLPDTDQPWGAPGANATGVHIEMCGFARWKNADWHHHESMLHRTAFKVAAWCKAYGIPPVHLSVPDLKAGKKGIVTHADVTAAWHLTNHTDPGVGFPMIYFIGLVKSYLAPPPPPSPPLKHFSVSYADAQGQQHTDWHYVTELEAFARNVAAHHAGDPGPYPIILTFDPTGHA